MQWTKCATWNWSTCTYTPQSTESLQLSLIDASLIQWEHWDTSIKAYSLKGESALPPATRSAISTCRKNWCLRSYSHMPWIPEQILPAFVKSKLTQNLCGPFLRAVTADNSRKEHLGNGRHWAQGSLGKCKRLCCCLCSRSAKAFHLLWLHCHHNQPWQKLKKTHLFLLYEYYNT